MTDWMTAKGVTSASDTYYTTLLDSLNGTSGVVTTGMATLTTDTTTKNNDMKTAAETYGTTRFADIEATINNAVENEYARESLERPEAPLQTRMFT